MSRPSDTTTKAIACRVPMQDYIRILTEASGKGMAIGEWLLLKVYAGDEKKTQQDASNAAGKGSGKVVEELRAKVKALTSANSDQASKIKSLQADVSQYSESDLHYRNVAREEKEKNKESMKRIEFLEAEILKMKNKISHVSGEIRIGNPEMGYENVRKILRGLD